VPGNAGFHGFDASAGQEPVHERDLLPASRSMLAIRSGTSCEPACGALSRRRSPGLLFPQARRRQRFDRLRPRSVGGRTGGNVFAERATPRAAQPSDRPTPAARPPQTHRAADA
jgi:hypothetical protein